MGRGQYKSKAIDMDRPTMFQAGWLLPLALLRNQSIEQNDTARLRDVFFFPTTTTVGL